MISVPLYSTEFVAMLSFLSRISATQLDVPLKKQPVPVAVLLAYQSRLTFTRIYSWKNRRTDRMYNYNMPTHVAVALYHELIAHPLTDHQRSLLHRLDQALTNYQLPMDERLALTTNLLHAATA